MSFDEADEKSQDDVNETSAALEVVNLSGLSGRNQDHTDKENEGQGQIGGNRMASGPPTAGAKFGGMMPH